jgi:hypothetical protein
VSFGEVYRPRWQYHAPWTLTRPWLPRAGTGSDEFCNDSVYAVLPFFLGMIVVFWRPGQLRVAEDGPCEACLWEKEYDRMMGWTVSVSIIDEYADWINGTRGEDEDKK